MCSFQNNISSKTSDDIFTCAFQLARCSTQAYKPRILSLTIDPTTVFIDIWPIKHSITRDATNVIPLVTCTKASISCESASNLTRFFFTDRQFTDSSRPKRNRQTICCNRTHMHLSSARRKPKFCRSLLTKWAISAAQSGSLWLFNQSSIA